MINRQIQIILYPRSRTNTNTNGNKSKNKTKAKDRNLNTFVYKNAIEYLDTDEAKYLNECLYNNLLTSMGNGFKDVLWDVIKNVIANKVMALCLSKVKIPSQILFEPLDKIVNMSQYKNLFACRHKFGTMDGSLIQDMTGHCDEAPSMILSATSTRTIP